MEFESITSFLKTPKTPQYVPLYSANFAFSHSDILKQVPYQENTPFLFFGEEMFMAVRALSHGWDMVGMTHSVAYHLWVRDYRRVYLNEVDRIKTRNDSIAWIKDVMTGKIKDPLYGMGNIRTWDEIQNYLGIDFKTKTFTRPHKPWRLPKEWKHINDEYVK